MTSRILKVTLIAVLCMTSIAGYTQTRGDSVRITIGKVEGAQRVRFDDNAGGGALLGGATGWAIARNQSSSRQAAAAIAGGSIGAASARNRNGGMGMQYRVRTAEGSAVSIITDQTEVRIGDCVSVEETGKTANIRRVDDDLCKPASPEVVETVAPTLQAEADRCEQAKERLFEAKTSEDVEVARQIMDAFCND